MPSVATVDADARAAGNDKALAERVGASIFSKEWAVQVLGVSADRIGDHTVLGMRLSGVKFHTPITRSEYIAEIVGLIRRAFAAAPNAEEVDLWTIVPLPYQRGEIVSGNLAQPTSRIVFTVSALRAQAQQSLRSRILAGTGIYWDQDWARAAFKQGS